MSIPPIREWPKAAIYLIVFALLVIAATKVLTYGARKAESVIS